MLTKKEKLRVRKHFGADLQHPLFIACDNVFGPRAGKLESVKADAEEIFCEVAQLLDKLMSIPEDSILQEDINDIYNRLIRDIREWGQASVEDRRVIVDTVFRIVRKLMCHRWDVLHSEEVYEMMGITLEQESEMSDKKFDERLWRYSSELDEWVNQDYDGHLCDAIVSVLKGNQEKPKARSGRKSIDPKNITDSFKYTARMNMRGPRLQAFYHLLHRKFIHTDTEERTFIDIFSGATTTEKIIWVRSIRELHYLFDKLTASLVTYPKTYGKWQMVCARFNILVKKKECVDDSLTDDSFVIESLQPTQFSKDGDIPQSHEELDNIIRVLDPKVNIEDEIKKIFDSNKDEGEHDEMEDYRDALANNLQVRDRI